MIYLNVWLAGIFITCILIPTIGSFVNGLDSTLQKMKSGKALVAIVLISLFWPLAVIALLQVLYENAVELVRDLIAGH